MRRRSPRWTRFELHYRSDIVKREAWPRLPGSMGADALDGYTVETLEMAMVCDHCSEAVDAGTQVVYHQRLGTISCPRCAPQLQVPGLSGRPLHRGPALRPGWPAAPGSAPRRSPARRSPSI